MVQAWIREAPRWGWPIAVVLGACLGMAACSDGEAAAEPEQTELTPQAPVPPQRKPDTGPAARTGTPRAAHPAPRPAPTGGPQPHALMSTSGADATAGQVWGEVIGSNVGAAQSCGASESQVADYLEQVQWHVARLGTQSTPPQDYLQAYEQSRGKSASVVRGEDECKEILSAIER